jgi:hypothetical protein
MKIVAREVTKIDDLFVRKSKSSKGKSLAKSKKAGTKKFDRTPTSHNI